MPTREEWLTANIPNPYATSTTNTAVTNLLPGITYTPGSSTDWTAANIPTVDDPETTYANISRDEFLRQKNQYGQFTRDAVSTALTDTSLIDQAREDAPKLAALSKGIVRRNQERYGVSLTPAQLKARENATNRASSLATIGGINNARINQLEQNRTSIARLMAVSSNAYSEALGGLGTAAANAASRTQAFKSAKANARSQRINGVGTAVVAGIMMF